MDAMPRLRNLFSRNSSSPFWVIALPVDIWCEKHSDSTVHKAHNASVGGPRNSGLEILHDAKRFCRPLISFPRVVGQPHSLIWLARYTTGFQVFQGDQGCPVHFSHPALVVTLLAEEGQIQDGERDKLGVEDNVLEVLLIEEAVGDSNLAKSFGPRHLWTDTRAAWKVVQSKKLLLCKGELFDDDVKKLSWWNNN